MSIQQLSRAGNVLSVGFATLLANSLYAHGWVVAPASRQQLCASGRGPVDCGDVKYEPQSVEAPKGSLLCSGGGRFGILDADLAWPATRIGRDVNITWTLTAPHRTSTWEYYVDGNLHHVVDDGHVIPPSSVTHTLRNLPSGRHTVLAIWNISDTINAFYNCVDLDIE